MKEVGQNAILYSGDVRAKNVKLTQERETILRNFKNAHNIEKEDREYEELKVKTNYLNKQMA